MTAFTIRVLGPGDEAVLSHVAEGTFDNPVDPATAKVYLNDAKNLLLVALDDGTVVGFVSAIEYLHPDKPRSQLWINEVGVAPAHRRRGVATALLKELLETARERGVGEAWVATESDNGPALGPYPLLGGEQAPVEMARHHKRNPARKRLARPSHWAWIRQSALSSVQRVRRYARVVKVPWFLVTLNR